MHFQVAIILLVSNSGFFVQIFSFENVKMSLVATKYFRGLQQRKLFHFWRRSLWKILNCPIQILLGGWVLNSQVQHPWLCGMWMDFCSGVSLSQSTSGDTRSNTCGERQLAQDDRLADVVGMAWRGLVVAILWMVVCCVMKLTVTYTVTCFWAETKIMSSTPYFHQTDPPSQFS